MRPVRPRCRARSLGGRTGFPLLVGAVVPSAGRLLLEPFGPDVVDAVVVEGGPGRLQGRSGRVGFAGHAPDYPLRGTPSAGAPGVKVATN
jgi:hypothetical protein